MAKIRIHELAKQWGVESKDIVARLDKMGVTGKKPQSGLTDLEAERVHDAMGLGPQVDLEPVVTRRTVETGDRGAAEAVVTEVTEKRIKRGVVLRRTKRTGPDGGPAAPASIVPPGLRVSTAVAVAPDVLATFGGTEFAYAAMPAAQAAEALVAEVPEGLPEAEGVESATPATADGAAAAANGAEAATAEPEEEEFEHTPVEEPDKLAEELLSHAEAEAARVKEEAEAAARAKEEAEAAARADEEAAEAARLAAAEEAAKEPAAPEQKRGAARVLGRIDLSAKQKPVEPEKKAAAKDGDKPAGDADKPGRKRKRKVVRKEDMFDAFERSIQARQRRPMKKRVAPGAKVQKTELTTPKASKRVIKINDVTTPGEMAKSLGIKAGEVLGQLMKLGSMKSINDAIDLDTATLLAEEFGYTVENTALNVDELLQVTEETETTDAQLEPRPPVVTVMGHVDHGKTSLLDVIRKSDVVAGEAGGITQHIGAYMVPTSQGEICFLDTPGHAAFTAMRARGASITDIVVLVVAADDGVMPQTIEAINHAQAAKIPVVVAVNKMDRPDANPDRVKQQLSEHGLQPEDWGGETQFIEVSAIQKTGIDTLLESVALLAQVLELKAAPEGPAHGIIVEARLDKGRGPVATLLVQQGTLARSDYFVVGKTTGRVRAMNDHTGRQVSSAGPSHPVEILGLDAVPQAGDTFDAVADAGKAEKVADHRRDAARKAQQAATARMSLEDLQAQIAAGNVSELKVVVKADVQGSAEALKQSFEKLSTAEVALNVIHVGVGAINESDVQLALASNAVVVGFHVRPEGKARTLAEREGVDIRLHTVIYDAIDELTAALEGLLAPDYKEAFEGRAEVRDTFSVPGGHTIAGCYVTEGKIGRNAQCRLLRDNVVMHTGNVGSLRRFKDDVREVATGYECGIGIDRYNDLKPGDVIECFRMDEVKRTLAEASTSSAPAGAPA